MHNHPISTSSFALAAVTFSKATREASGKVYIILQNGTCMRLMLSCAGAHILQMCFLQILHCRSSLVLLGLQQWCLYLCTLRAQKLFGTVL